MSQLPAEVQKPLVDLLQALQATDNTTRSKAEEQLSNEWFVEHADWLLVGLAEQIQSAQETQVGLSMPYHHIRQVCADSRTDSVVCGSAIQTASLQDQETGRPDQGMLPCPDPNHSGYHKRKAPPESCQ